MTGLWVEERLGSRTALRLFPLLGERARVRASQFSNCVVPVAEGNRVRERDTPMRRAAISEMPPAN